MIRSAIFITVFLAAVSAPLHAQPPASPLRDLWQQGQPYITTYLHQEYKADLQMWSFAQTASGMIYAGNTDGVLEYDGVSWRLIQTPRKNPVKSLIRDSQGRVYAGGVDEVGYLEHDPVLGTRFHSLMPELGAAATSFGDIWFTQAVHDTIYFVADHHVLRWAGGRFKVWGEDTPLKMGFAWAVRGRMYIDTPDRGLLQFIGDSLLPAPGGEAFRGKDIKALVPYGEKDLLAISNDATYVYDGRQLTVHPEPSRQRPTEVYGAIQLSSGYYAVITQGDGVYLLDERGFITNHFTRNEGLTSNMIDGVYEDAEGDLWLATLNGINRIELNSPLRLLTEAYGLEERSTDLAFFNQGLYVATPNGILQVSDYQRNAQTAQPPVFKPVAGLNIYAWECKAIGPSLIVSSHSGLYDLSPQNRVSTILAREIIPIAEFPAQEPDHFFFGTEGMHVGELFRQNGSWKPSATQIEIGDRPVAITRRNNGNVLINTRRGVLYEINWAEKKKSHTLSDPHQLIRYDTASGLPMHDNDALTVVDTTIYMTSYASGIYRFDPHSRTFKPDAAVMRLVPYKNVASWGPITPALDGGFWFSTYADNQTRLFRYDGRRLTECNAVVRIADLVLERMLDQDKDILAIASTDHGVILYNKSMEFNNQPPFKTVLRKVLIHRDSVIYAGYAGDQHAANWEIAYDANDLRFQFSLPSYDLSAQNQYQYLLEGADQAWSAWSTESQVDLTNLSEGNYTFRVRGKNIYGQVGDEDAFTFKVLPPWYRTWWAYALYIVGLAGIIIALINWRIRNLKREKVVLEQVIQERTKEISQQTEKLKEMDLVKSRFFANISHEFRTPLSLILAPTEDKLNTPGLPAAERTSTLLVRRNANRLLSLVNQLLDLSKLESGKMVLHIQQGNLERFIRIMASSYDSLAENKKITFVKHIDIPEQDAWYDADKLEKIINNVLFNAFTFTPAGGTITFAANMQPPVNDAGYLGIEISDTGRGIPEDEQQHIFSPFYQSSLTDDGSGTGLGLALVNELVSLHGGRLGLQSKPGQGTTISITLPCTREKFPAGTLVSSAPADLDDPIHTPGNALNTGEWPEGEPEETDADADTLHADTVLIIEDNAELRDYIAAALSDRLRTLVARDGEEGLALAALHTPNLIISDVMMPGMTGVELTARVKADIRTSHIPVILLTARIDQGSRMEGLAAGADDYITKPFYTEELRLRATNLIEQRKKLATLYMAGLVPHQPMRGPSLDEKFIQKVREITEANLSNLDFSVEKMADEVHLSRSQLFRKLKSVTGLTPTEFISDMRLNKAAELILTNTDKLSQIGYSVGFKEPSYFSKSFRKKFGVNPSEYAAKA